MGRKRPKIKIGEPLLIARNKKNLSLSQVIAKLQLLGVKCSKSNLSRIENNQTPCRHDILAGLSIVYEISLDSIVFETR